MKILICGGRDFYNWPLFVEGMLQFYDANPGKHTEYISGGARGADTLAEEWAKMHNTKITVLKAEWDKYGRSAGYKRNVAMADLKPNWVIAFPGGRGTQMMINIATQRGIPVFQPTL